MATPYVPESAPLSPAAHLPDLYTIESPELRAAVSTRTPIRFTEAGEPYLPLPAPYENFYLSPMRQSDLPGDMAMMNDIRVVLRVYAPFPNPLINAQRHLVRQRALVTALFASYASGTFLPAASSPFDVLRERRSFGPDAYVGQVTIGPESPDARRVSPISDKWEAWRSTGVLGIGAALNVAYHRKGVASAAVRMLLDEWAVPQMGATEIHARAHVANVASVKLWEKHGFVEEPGMRGVVNVSEAKGGGVEKECVLVWRFKE